MEHEKIKIEYGESYRKSSDKILNVRCDECCDTAAGTEEELVELGWSHADIFEPKKAMITYCPKCYDPKKMADRISDIIKKENG